MASVVDTSLPAKPTGAAAAFAASHAAEHDLKLYGGWFCPFVQRAWVVLHEKRIAHQYVEINPYHKSAEFLALNPRGLVPTLAVPRATAGRGDGDGDGGGIGGEKPLYESTIICEYLDEAYGDESAHGPALLPRGDAPADVYLRARCRLWIDHIGGKVVPAFYKMLQHTPDKAHSMAEARREFLAHARTLVREMGAGGPWFLGARFSLVDVMLAPWAKRLFLIDHYKPGGVGIPTAGEEEEEEDAEVWDRWRLWFDAITQRQSVKDTWSDDEMYIRSYKRYAEDTTESEVGRATRKGERLP